MPKYELMYILSSAVSDNDAPGIASELDKYITEQGGKIISQEMLGKKKLAYPIGKTRNGFYILESFNFEGPKIKGLENKIRSIDSIIRFLVVNLEEQERRAAVDREVQAKMKAHREMHTEAAAATATAKAPEAINLSESELEKKIEKALESGDLSK